MNPAPGLSAGDWIALVSLLLGGVTVPIGLVLWGMNRERVVQHNENKRKFEEIIEERKYHPNHSHPEVEGPLYAENIKVSPLRINGK